jgi:hypothetical protein
MMGEIQYHQYKKGWICVEIVVGEGAWEMELASYD